MDEAINATKQPKTEAQLRELASLARLIVFARQNAKELNAEFSAYCLDLALGALLQDLDAAGQPELIITDSVH